VFVTHCAKLFDCNGSLRALAVLHSPALVTVFIWIL